MRAIYLACALVLLSACEATPSRQYHWVKDGSTREQLTTEASQCEERALSVTGVSTQRGIEIYGACMRGKNWRYVER